MYIREGHYEAEYLAEDRQISRRSDKVKIDQNSDGSFKWTNSDGSSWNLYPMPSNLESWNMFQTPKDPNILRVGRECKHYDDGYTTATFTASGVSGPNDQFYNYLGIY